MSDELTDSQTALLCDLGEFDLSKASADQKRDLEQLLAGGYVEREKHGQFPFKLTPKGAAFLGERGAGLNEA
jgi:hypothetical protein